MADRRISKLKIGQNVTIDGELYLVTHVFPYHIEAVDTNNERCRFTLEELVKAGIEEG